MSENLSVSARTTRLNSLILGRAEALPKEQKEICNGISRDGLLDALFVLYDECNKDAVKKKSKHIQDFTIKYRPIIRETKTLRVSNADFEMKTQIGNGYFGEVDLVTEKSSGDVFAMKTIKKTAVGNCRVKEERDIMILGRKSDWITKLQFAYQDRENLYLVMEYLPGGDLLGLMIRHGAFDEELARFYLAEIALALNALHTLGFVHRDVKPENILLDRFGHLKLADFGSALALNEDGSFNSISPVGTPDYIAPELLQVLSVKNNQKSQKLDVSCDFWSMGIIGFEMVTEKTPFHHDNLYDTYSEIQTFSNSQRLMQVLEFPTDVKMSRHLKDLLNGLITKPIRRMKFDEIQDHQFFRGIEWHNLRDQAPPIIPTLSREDDTSNFEDIDKSIKRDPVIKKTNFKSININEFSGEDLQFLGYTYIHEESSKFLKHSSSKSHNESRMESKLSNKIEDLQSTIKEQMREIKVLQKDLLQAEKKAIQMKSLEKIHGDTKDEYANMKTELKDKTSEVASLKTEVKMLKSSLKVEEEMRLKSDSSIADVLSQTYHKWEKAKKISDANFEKIIENKREEINSLTEKIKSNDIELNAKIDECKHLNKVVDKYKDMLKTTKDQHFKDKSKFDENSRKLQTNLDAKIQEHKQKLQIEKEKREESEKQLKILRKQLDDAMKSNTSLCDAKESSNSTVESVRKELNQKIDEISRLTRSKCELESQIEDSNRQNDELRKEMLSLQNENIKKQLKLSKIISQPIQIGGRTSVEAECYESAHASLTDLSIDQEELKSDLARARENEDVQRKRAEKLEKIVERLEEMVKENTVGGMLEKKNEKLEDKLAAVREEAILERQSARTANLALWKLEKEVNDVKHEKNVLQRRLDTANEKCSTAIHDKESVELKMKQQIETISIKETQIIDLQKDIRNLKFELRQEREKWSNNESDRLREKTEVIEGAAKIKNLEEKLQDANSKLKILDRKVSTLVDEKEVLERMLAEVQSNYAHSQDSVEELEDELSSMKKNHAILVEAATQLEHQVNVAQDMLNCEVKHNKENTERIDKQLDKIRNKEEEISKLKRELMQEKSLKISAENKGCQLQNEYDELKEEMQKEQQKAREILENSIKTQRNLYKTQENVEIISNDVVGLQKINQSYETEIRILKEDSTRILTDFYRAKEDIKRLTKELKECRVEVEDLEHEKDHLNGLLSELKTHSKERDIRTEATVCQQKKLIEYLTVRVEELQAKKKSRTIADVLFGSHTTSNPPPPQTPKSNRKENIPPNSQDVNKLKKAESELKKERERSQRLKENLIQTKLEMRKSSSAKSPQGRETRESTVDNVESTPRTIKATVHSPPEKQLQNEYRQRESNLSTPQSHRFDLNIDTSTKSTVICIACNRFILSGSPYWQCKECKFCVHKKCRADAPVHCYSGDAASSNGSSATTATLPCLNESRRSKKSAILDDVDGIKPFDDAEISSIGSGGDLGLQTYCGDHVLNSSRFGFGWGFATAPKINAVYELSEKIVLFGCSSGLYSYHREDDKIVHIKGIASVDYFAIKSNLNKSIFIGDEGENLYECDMRTLMIKSQQSSALDPKLSIQTIDLSIANRCMDEKWVRVAVNGTSDNLNNIIAIAATNARMVILKYDVKDGRFNPIRALDTVTAIRSVLFNPHSAIVACDKFYEVDMHSFVAEEFLDMSDHSLRPTTKCQPMNVFRINSNEILLCFENYGVFVDEYGLRGRKENLNWNHKAIDFFYKNYLLFIIHEETVQILKINNSTTKHEKDLLTDNNQSRTFVMIDGVKKFTNNGVTDQYTVNIIKNIESVDGTFTQDLITIDGEKAFKVNLNRSMHSIISDSATSLATLSSHGRSSLDTVN